MLKIFLELPFSWVATNIPEAYVHNNVIDFKKIFSKMLEYFQNFQKLNPLKISCYMVDDYM